MMKKLIAFLLALTLVLSMVACGGDTAADPVEDTGKETAGEIATPEPTAAPDAPEAVDPNAPITEELLRSLPANPASDFSYDSAEDGGIKIGEYLGSDTVVVIPDTIDGTPVTEIGGYLFANNDQIRAVRFPETVKHFYATCFNAPKLEVAIMEGAESLYTTFQRCTSLHTVCLGSGVRTIEHCAFGDCSELTELHLPKDLDQPWDDTVFLFCDKLTVVSEPGGVTEAACTAGGIAFRAE